jgi:hypothetical protein
LSSLLDLICIQGTKGRYNDHHTRAILTHDRIDSLIMTRSGLWWNKSRGGNCHARLQVRSEALSRHPVFLALILHFNLELSSAHKAIAPCSASIMLLLFFYSMEALSILGVPATWTRIPCHMLLKSPIPKTRRLPTQQRLKGSREAHHNGSYMTSIGTHP